MKKTFLICGIGIGMYWCICSSGIAAAYDWEESNWQTDEATLSSGPADTTSEESGEEVVYTSIEDIIRSSEETVGDEPRETEGEEVYESFGTEQEPEPLIEEAVEDSAVVPLFEEEGINRTTDTADLQETAYEWQPVENVMPQKKIQRRTKEIAYCPYCKKEYGKSKLVFCLDCGRKLTKKMKEY